MNTDEVELLKSLKMDDEIAFKVIFNTYYPRLYYFILEFVPTNDIAENIVQDTFFTLWDKRHELHDNTNFGAYLFTIARNNCLYRLRGKKYRDKIFIEHADALTDIEQNIATLSSIEPSVFIFEEIERIIQQTLDGLPPQCRNVFTLSRFEEKKNKEIAEELNISVKSVEKHITKGLKTLKIALKDYLPFVAYLFINDL